MLLLLMRHGIAEPLSAAIPDDFHRRLTAEGRDRTHRAALGLHQLVPKLDLLASSPKTRARQTAQIAREVFAGAAPHLIEWPELMEASVGAIIDKLSDLEAETVLLCGHEPYLSQLAAQLLTGLPDGLELEFKKAGVCALEVGFEPTTATLLWHLTPKQLRKIGGQTGK